MLTEYCAVLEGAARALFVCAWADREEERKRTKGWAGNDLMDLAPRTPRRAKLNAAYLFGQIQLMNKGLCPTSGLLAKAWKADQAANREKGELSPYADDDGWLNDLEYQGNFGHYLAMGALGHGVSWFDDHAKFELKLPLIDGYDL